MRAKRSILVLILFAATLTVRANDTPLLIELERSSGAVANEVNAAGTIVVGSFEDGSGGFYWMPTTGVVFIGGDLASSVSRDGRTIVGAARERGIQQAGIWLRGTEWRLLGGLTPSTVPCQLQLSSGVDVSADGRVVVGYAAAGTPAAPCSQSRAFRWEESTGMIDLGTLVPGLGSAARGVSGDGNVVVGLQEMSGPSLARVGARWVGGREELMPAAAGVLGGLPGIAHAANHDGSIIVGEICVPGAREPAIFQSAWIWTARDGTQCLPAPGPRLPEGVGNDAPVIVRALGTSEDGRIVVGEQGIGTVDTDAIIVLAASSPARAQSWEVSGFIGNTPSADLDRQAPELDELAIRGGFTWGPRPRVCSLPSGRPK
jgi:probable HAF family extracellular repeat protein